jgi:hypothetical protein
MVGMRDVAKKAGVSLSTVSLVVNGNGYVSDDMRERVRKAMQALNYVPRDCTANRITMITAVIIIVRSLFSVNRCSNAGSVFRPSTADEIDTAGVSTESARKAAPPSMAGMTSHAPYLRINEYRAKMILQKRTSKHPNSHHT